jgi:hypothetical protein
MPQALFAPEQTASGQSRHREAETTVWSSQHRYVPHSITAPEGGINIVIMPGTHTYTLRAKQTGRFLWFCTFRCDELAMEHPGYMSGYITVV